MIIQVNQAQLEIILGDITRQTTEAIVNAANSSLLGGGGVDGAIHRAGGPQILDECKKIGGCPPGEARITTGGRLQARYVIHAVGPIYRNGNQGEDKTLESAYQSSLRLAIECGIDSMAFPSISTGAYGYPVEKAAPIALAAVIRFIKQQHHPKLVRFVLFDPGTYDAYEKALKGLNPP